MIVLVRLIGLRHLTAQRLRTGLVLLAVALGVAALTAVQLTNASAGRSFRRAVDDVAGRAALEIVGPEGGFPENVRAVAAATKGVAAAVPLVVDHGFVARTGEAVEVFGLDLLDEATVRTYRSSGKQVIKDPLVFLNQPDSMLLGAKLASRLGLAVNDPLELLTSRGTKRFVVRGLLASKGPVRAFGGAFAVMDIDAAQLAFGKERRIDQIDLVLRPGADPGAVAAALAPHLPAALRVERPETRSVQIDRMLSGFDTLLTGFGALGLLAAAFVIYNAVAMAVGQRQREIGILRQLGVRRREMLTAVALEVGMVSALGAILGLGLGTAAATVLREPISRALANAAALDFPTSGLVVTPGPLAAVFFAGVLTSLAAALVPAWRAARTSPLVAARRSLLAEVPTPALRTVSVGLLLVSFLPLSLVALARLPATPSAVTPALVIGNLAFFVGLAVLGPILVRGFAPRLRRVLEAVFGSVGRLAGGTFSQAPWRTAATLAVLVVAISFMVIAGTLARSFQASLGVWLDQALPVDLTVRSAHTLRGWQAAPLADDLVGALDTVPGVEYALGKRMVTVPFDGHQVLLQALDIVPACVRCGQHALRIPFEAGDPDKAARLVASGQGVVVSNALAFRTQLRVGDPLTLNTPSGPLVLPVVGIVVDYTSNEGTIVIGRPLYVARWGDRRVNYVNLFLRSGTDSDAVRAAIARRFGLSRGVQVLTGQAQKADLVALVGDSFQFAYGLEALALAVALLGVAQMLLVSTLERIRDIGVLRALGMTRGQLRALVVIEAGTVGVVGSLLGVGAGAVLSLAWVNVYFTRLIGWFLAFHFPAGVAAQAALAAVAVALVAGLYPARRASAVPLTESMRHE